MERSLEKTDGTYFTTDGTLLIKNGDHYNTYSDGSRTYFGNHIVIPKATVGRSDLTLVTLVPEISYQSSVAKNRMFWLCGGLGFLVLMLLAAMFLTRRFMLPIQKRIRALKEQKEPPGRSIPESSRSMSACLRACEAGEARGGE